MVAEPLFTPVSFVRDDMEVIHYGGGSMIFYGPNGVGKSYLLEAVASSLQGEVLGRIKDDVGHVIPEEEGYVGVIARLRGDVTPGDVADVFSPPPGHYPYDQVEEVRKAVEASRLSCVAVSDDVEVVAAVGELLDEFATLELVFLAPLVADLGPGWRLHVAARGNGSTTRDLPLPIAHDVWQISSPEDPEDVTAYRFNGFKPHLRETEGIGQTVFGRVIDDSRVDVASITRQWLRERGTSRWVDGSKIEGETLDALRALADEWAVRANQLLRTFMIDPPELSVRFRDPVAWMLGDSPEWRAGTDAIAPGLDRLSFAERRWAQIAIALTAETGDTPYLIIDEPERGLHRFAEGVMADGLRKLVSDGRVRLIAATHSPELIDADFGQLFYLAERWGTPKELTRDEVKELQSFDLQPTSRLAQHRGYLLVEGEHDKQILEGYFADDLDELGVKVLAMRGARNLVNVFDSELLIGATDALLMPLLDDIELDPLLDLWAAAEAATISGRNSDAVGVIQHRIRKIPGNAKDIYEPLLIGTITRGVSQRFLPLGMSKKDVLEYLPVEQMVDGASTWQELRREWNRSPASMADRSGKAYKTWLRKVKHADLSPENLRFVAETAGGPPPELKAVIARIADRLDAGTPRME